MSLFCHYPKLWRVTFTGVDESTDLRALHELDARYPGMIEWGVLYSPQRAGQGRYPSWDWVKHWATHRGSLQSALHLCGQGAQDWLQKSPGELHQVASAFDRLQINVLARRVDIPAFRTRLEAGIHPMVITQAHAGNAALTEGLAGLPNHALLFDGSGGRGQLPSDWPAPYAGDRCGYAGGLGPATIAVEATKIASVSAHQPYWLDMEQAVRSEEDSFDLERVECVMEQLVAGSGASPV